MRIGQFVSELVTATIQKNLFNGCSIFKTGIRLASHPVPFIPLAGQPLPLLAAFPASGALLCFCFALLCFALLCFALLCFAGPLINCTGSERDRPCRVMFRTAD